MSGKFAICMDGGFVIKKLQERHHHFPTVAELIGECARIKAHPALAAKELLRIYFYDARPATGRLKNPIDGTTLNLGTTAVHAQCTSLHQALEMQPDFALRMGEAPVHGWTFGSRATRALARAPRAPTAGDLVPNIEQKGVDLRIGLDIARLSLRALVDVVVAVTGDSDLIPAFTFARREGIRIYLDHMGHGVKRELKVHTDLIL
jgi:uncharacterized LabA/DUF88 family protein